jgi:hypothetical protein
LGFLLLALKLGFIYEAELTCPFGRAFLIVAKGMSVLVYLVRRRSSLVPDILNVKVVEMSREICATVLELGCM